MSEAFGPDAFRPGRCYRAGRLSWRRGSRRGFAGGEWSRDGDARLPRSLHRVLAAACEPVPAWDPVVYLADFARQVLFPLAAGVAEEDVEGTMAGRAFATGQPASAERDGSVRVWVPVVEQTTRTGVLAITVPQASPEIMAQAELLGVFAGLTAAAATRVSDVPYIRRRGRAMSLPASMQWDLLPPLSAHGGGAVIAGLLEPAYDIAGDAFDYAVNHGDLHFAIIDGVGHGIGSTLLTGLTVGAYRHARRGGATLPRIHQAMDAALAGYYDDLSFATGVIGRLATESGRLEWSCPRPLLLRGRNVVAELAVIRRSRSGSAAQRRPAPKSFSRTMPCCCTPTA